LTYPLIVCIYVNILEHGVRKSGTGHFLKIFHVLKDDILTALYTFQKFMIRRTSRQIEGKGFRVSKHNNNAKLRLV
jgi:hypothetical protein